MSVRLLLVACWVVWLGGAPARGADDGSITALRSRLASHPEDVDARLRLATLLSWRGARGESRWHARQVVLRAPKYWDAHILIARLDTWDRRYTDARERLERILPHLKSPRDALLLLTDIAIWTRKPAAAERYLKALAAEERSADLLYRRAQVAHLRHRYVAAWRLAGKALALNPEHTPSRRLREDIVLARLDVAYDLEVFTALSGDARFGHATRVSVQSVPRSVVSATLTNEYQRRFGTDNFRLAIRVDWRVTSWVELAIDGGFGAPAKAVSQGTAAAHARFEVWNIVDAAASYRYDRPPWGGDLHRVRFDVGVRLPLGFHVAAAYTTGAVDRCGGAAVLHSTELRAQWVGARARTGLFYGWGMEFDKPTVPTAARRLWDDAGCPTALGRAQAPLDLVELRAHTVGGWVELAVTRQYTVRLGYDAQIRDRGGAVHGLRTAFRTSF